MRKQLTFIMRGFRSFLICNLFCFCMQVKMPIPPETEDFNWPPDIHVRNHDTFLTLLRQPSETPHTLPRHHRLRVEYIQQEKSIWWVGGTFFQKIIPLRCSILQVGTCQILSLAENPRWSRVWQLRSAKKSYLDKWHLWTNLTWTNVIC